MRMPGFTAAASLGPSSGPIELVQNCYRIGPLYCCCRRTTVICLPFPPFLCFKVCVEGFCIGSQDGPVIDW